MFIFGFDQDGDIGGSWVSLLPSMLKYAAIYGTILFEKNPETSCIIPTHWMTEKTPTSKWVGNTDKHLP